MSYTFSFNTTQNFEKYEMILIKKLLQSCYDNDDSNFHKMLSTEYNHINIIHKFHKSGSDTQEHITITFFNNFENKSLPRTARGVSQVYHLYVDDDYEPTAMTVYAKIDNFTKYKKYNDDIESISSLSSAEHKETKSITKPKVGRPKGSAKKEIPASTYYVV